MKMTEISMITILCYLIGEIVKVVFKKKEDIYKLIPAFLTLLGGIIGVLIFLIDKQYLGVDNLLTSFEIGLISGSASTGVHQIIKQFITKKGDLNA